MNKSLYNHIIILPQSLVDHLDVCFKQVNGDQNTEGWKRNQELRKNKQITYQNLKRVKNWFDSYSGKKEDAPFILNGGDRIVCDNCGWNWPIADGGDDPYICHKCGHDNIDEYDVENEQDLIMWLLVAYLKKNTNPACCLPTVAECGVLILNYWYCWPPYLRVMQWYWTCMKLRYRSTLNS